MAFNSVSLETLGGGGGGGGVRVFIPGRRSPADWVSVEDNSLRVWRKAFFISVYLAHHSIMSSG
ncbi:hypothetical protein QUB47_07200 [Microcoleus sp. AT9_B5]